MRIETFEMERMQSTYENQVAFNLSESGVRPLSPRELLGGDAAAADGLLDQPLVYTQSNGTPELRAAVAALYPGAGPDHVEVTNGGSEANYVAVWRLVEPGDEVVMLVPNYMQTWGLARGFGATVREWRLVEDRASGRWRADLEALDALVGPRTKLVVVCTPNNPTGARLTAAELDALPVLARGAALRFLLTRSYDWFNTDGEALVKRKDPNEYLRKLRFHRRVKSYRDYGLEELRH